MIVLAQNFAIFATSSLYKLMQKKKKHVIFFEKKIIDTKG